MLNSKQLRLLHRSVISEFKDSALELESLLVQKLGVPLEQLLSPGELTGRISELLQAAERAGWTRELIQTLSEVRPNSSDLKGLYQEVGLASNVTFQTSGAEQSADVVSSVDDGYVNESAGFAPQPPFFEIGLFREQLAATEQRVCRVEVGGRAFGTGFLVGPDTVLTCYHVVSDAIGDSAAASRIRLRFDYRVIGDAVTDGLVVAAHPTDWLVASAPAPESLESPEAGELNYALLRLARPIGNEPLNPNATGGTVRGWIGLPDVPPELTVGMPLSIAQYALGGPLKIAVDERALVGVTSNGLRVRYATMTVPGSSGGPCFNATWALVAMHEGKHMSSDGATRLSGQGIPVYAIREAIFGSGRGAALGGDVPMTKPVTLNESSPPPPTPIIHKDDPQRDRWDGQSEQNGRKVTVKVSESTKSWFTFDARVSSTDGSELQAPILFHLHDTFPKSVIWIRKIQHNKLAQLYDVHAYGVFCIGVQVKDATGRWVGLEFDLSTLTELSAEVLRR